MIRARQLLARTASRGKLSRPSECMHGNFTVLQRRSFSTKHASFITREKIKTAKKKRATAEQTNEKAYKSRVSPLKHEQLYGEAQNEEEDNIRRAVVLYKKLAKEGHVKSMLRLGHAFAAGDLDLPRDLEQSERWFSTAIAHGSAAAERALENLRPYQEALVEKREDEAYAREKRMQAAKPAPPKKRKVAKQEWRQDEEKRTEELTELSVAELRDLCDTLDASKTGTKTEMIARILRLEAQKAKILYMQEVFERGAEADKREKESYAREQKVEKALREQEALAEFEYVSPFDEHEQNYQYRRALRLVESGEDAKVKEGMTELVQLAHSGNVAAMWKMAEAALLGLNGTSEMQLGALLFWVKRCLAYDIPSTDGAMIVTAVAHEYQFAPRGRPDDYKNLRISEYWFGRCINGLYDDIARESLPQIQARILKIDEKLEYNLETGEDSGTDIAEAMKRGFQDLLRDEAKMESGEGEMPPHDDESFDVYEGATKDKKSRFAQPEYNNPLGDIMM